jgi:hypothetical protein
MMLDFAGLVKVSLESILKISNGFLHE